MNTILLIEDNNRIMESNKEYLEFQGYSVLTASSLRVAQAVLESNRVDLMILDIMLPDGSGIDFCARMREYMDVPVLFLTCLNDDASLVAGLKAGGDEYMTKPYSLAALSARAEALLRRVKMDKTAEQCFTTGPLLINAGKRRVILDGTEIPLSPKEYDILQLLARNMGKAIAAEEIYAQIWGGGLFDKRTVIVHISSLRKKLRMDDESPLTISTEGRKGYCLRAE